MHFFIYVLRGKFYLAIVNIIIIIIIIIGIIIDNNKNNQRALWVMSSDFTYATPKSVCQTYLPVFRERKMKPGNH